MGQNTSKEWCQGGWACSSSSSENISFPSFSPQWLPFLEFLLLKKLTWVLHDSQNGKWCRNTASRCDRKDCHTYAKKSRLCIWKTCIIQHFSNVNLSSQVSCCSPFLIIWPLPHSMSSDTGSLPPPLSHTSSIVLLFQPSASPMICTFLRTGSEAFYHRFAYQVNLPHHLTAPSCKFLDLHFITFLYGSHLTIITFTSGSVFGSAATVVTWSSIKLCFSEKVNKINLFPEAARHGQLLRLYRPVLAWEIAICWPARNSSLKDPQSQEDARDLGACGERSGREGRNMNSNLFRNLRIYVEMGSEEEEPSKSTSCWEVSDNTHNQLGRREYNWVTATERKQLGFPQEMLV